MVKTKLDDHDHGHHHGHDHDDQHDHFAQHRPNDTSGDTELRIAVALTTLFMLVEFVGGLIAGSMTLVADAGHMLTDAGALALSLYALRAGRRPADDAYSYGRQRFEVLAAFANGLLLLFLSAVILVEAVRRLWLPQPLAAGIMLSVATAGIVVNLLTLAVLRGRHHHGPGDDAHDHARDGDMNRRGAILHVIGDLLGSIAAVIAALLIPFTGWLWLDPALSILVTLMIVRGGWRLTREAGHILLEGTPTGFDAAAVSSDLMQSIPGLHSVHHLHAWALTGQHPLMTLHVVFDPAADRDRGLSAVHLRLRERFGVEHATVQLESVACEASPVCGPRNPRPLGD